MAMVGRMVGEWLLYCHMRQKKTLWATSLCLAVKYVGAQKFCVVLLRRHPDGVDISVRGMVLSARDRGGAESHNGGVPRAAEEIKIKI